MVQRGSECYTECSIKGKLKILSSLLLFLLLFIIIFILYLFFLFPGTKLLSRLHIFIPHLTSNCTMHSWQQKKKNSQSWRNMTCIMPVNMWCPHMHFLTNSVKNLIAKSESLFTFMASYVQSTFKHIYQILKITIKRATIIHFIGKKIQIIKMS